MVQDEVTIKTEDDAGNETPSTTSSSQAVPEEPINLARGVDPGRYRLVGWAVDTTGRRLIDEICHIAAYTPDSKFSLYIMPYHDIHVEFKRRLNIRLINIDRYRYMKDIRTNKFVKTRSEVSAITDFVAWLEENRGDATEGIILLYHEFHKSTPAMLLEALRRHNLVERFAKVVKGFANVYDVLRAKCAKSAKSFNLYTMTKVLLNKDEDLTNAVRRAQSCYEITVHLGQGERDDLDAKASGDCKGNESHLVDLMRPFTNPIVAEEEEIEKLKALLKRQNTFKPVFGVLMRAPYTERQHASHLRRMLAENNVDYDKLKDAFVANAKKGLEDVLRNEIINAKEEELNELLDILDCFFDPEKEQIMPKRRYYPNNYKPRPKKLRKKKKSISSDKNMNNNTENSNKNIEPTTTTETVVDEKPNVVAAEIKVES